MLNSSAYTWLSWADLARVILPARAPRSPGDRRRLGNVPLPDLRRAVVHEDGDRHDAVALGGLHDRHAAARAPVAVHAAHLGPQDRAFLGDQHHLFVVAADDPDGGYVAGLRVERVGDDAAGGPMLDRELAQRHALAIALLGHHQELLGGIDDLHADHLVPRPQADAGDAHRVPTHRPHLVLMEARGLSLAGGQDDVALSIRHTHPAQLVAAYQVDGDQPIGADLRVLDERGLLDLPATGRHHHVLIRLESR